jgi:hypothetical protein
MSDVTLTAPAGGGIALIKEDDLGDILAYLQASWTVNAGVANPYPGLRNPTAAKAALAALLAQTSFPLLELAIPIWVKFTVGFAAFSTAGLANTITLFNLPAAGVVHAIRIKHSTLFGGGTIASYTVSVGISGNHTKYAAAFDVHQAVADTAFQLSTTVGQESSANIVAITATATSTVGNLNAATGGSVDVWALISRTS